MTAKEKSRHEIAEAFDFLRFLMRNPKEIKRIKNGSTVEIVSRELSQKKESRVPSRGRAFSHAHYLSEHTFHRL